MKHLLIPCFSNAPDRQYDAVVLAVDEALLNSLRARRDAFVTLAADPDLHAHEYRAVSLYYLQLDDDWLDAPDTAVELQSHLNELELFGPWQLEAIREVYLNVIEEGFCYTWDGRREKHGPSETYETDPFTLEELETLF